MSRYDGKGWGVALVGKRLLEIREDGDLYIKTNEGIWTSVAEGD